MEPYIIGFALYFLISCIFMKVCFSDLIIVDIIICQQSKAVRHILLVIFNPSFLHFLFPVFAFFTVSNTHMTFKFHGCYEHSRVL